MIKMLDLLPEDEVLEKCRASLASLQAVIVFNWATSIGGNVGVGVIDHELTQEVCIRLHASSLQLFLLGIGPSFDLAVVAVRALRDCETEEAKDSK